MGKLFSFLIILLLVSGCYHENKPPVKVPQRLLPVDTFVMVMADVEIAEGAIEYSREHNIRNKKNSERFYSYIYEKYNLTPVLLKENMDYYNSNPDNMIDIYDKVLARLTETQTVLELKKKIREKEIRDSIARIDTNHYIYIQIKPLKKHKDSTKINWPIW